MALRKCFIPCSLKAPPARLAGLIVSLIYRRSRAAGLRDVANCAAAMSEASRLAEAQYQTLFKGNPVPSFICDTRKWRVLEVNDARRATMAIRARNC